MSLVDRMGSTLMREPLGGWLGLPLGTAIPPGENVEFIEYYALKLARSALDLIYPGSRHEGFT